MTTNNKLNTVSAAKRADKGKKTKICLKFGVLKWWEMDERGSELVDKYDAVCNAVGTMQVVFTPALVEALFNLIDYSDKIFLSHEDKYVSKPRAKEYVLGYIEECKADESLSWKLSGF